jgi:hypothetical protein
MKTFLNLIMALWLMLLMPLIVVAQDAEPEPVGIWATVIAVLLILQEVAGRLWPNKNYNGLVGIIINLLKWISDALNRGGKDDT